jgi:hypothetical protein
MYRGGFRRPEFTSFEEWWGRHRADYYAAFRCLGPAFDPNVDVTPFVHAHVEAQLHQVRVLDLRERVQQRIWTAVEKAVTSAGLQPRVANAVWDVFFGRSVVTTRQLVDKMVELYWPTRCRSRAGLRRASSARTRAGRSISCRPSSHRILAGDRPPERENRTRPSCAATARP